jgi:hypothetical protein
MHRTFSLFTAGLIAAATSAQADGKPDFNKLDLSKVPPAAKTAGLTYTKDIQPMLEKSCTRCHGQDRPKANLRLDRLEAAIKGGKDGKVIETGNGLKSWIVVAAAQINDDVAMVPPEVPAVRVDTGLVLPLPH